MRLLSSFFMLMLSTSAYALQPFDKTQFEKDLNEGRPVVIQVSVPWCGHCMMQKRALNALQKDPKYTNYGYYQLPRSGADDAKQYLNTNFVDAYRKDQDDEKVCNLNTRSTLVVISNKKVTNCSAFETKKDLIEVMLNSA